MRRLEVQIVGDASSLERAFARANKSTQKFERDVSRATRGGLAASGAFKQMGRAVSFASPQFLTGAGLVAGLKTSIDAASDLNEEMSKTQVVFGDSAQSVEDWAKTTTDAFGVSQREALATASSFGALFQPMGLVGAKAAEQSQRLTQLGADLASFYNTSVQDALDAIRSGIVGESEPLRRYGVLLSETRVQQEALAETHKRSAKQLTVQDKALARINLIYRDTTQAQGDFQRTSGGLANQLRKAQANIDNLKVAIGTGLLPQVTKLVGAFNDLVDVLPQVNKQLGETEKKTGLLGSAFHFIRTTSLKDIIGDEIDRWNKLQIMLGITHEQAKKVIFDFNSLHALTKGVTPVGPPPFSGPGGLAGAVPIPATGINITTEQRNQFRDRRLQRMLDRVQDIPTLQGQIKRLREISKLVQQWIDAAKDVTRKQTLQDDLLQIQRDILADQEQIASDAADAAQKAAEKQKELAQKRREALVARQFGILGLGPTGEDPIPGMKALRRQLARVADRLKGTELDTRGNRSLLQRIRKALDFKTLEPEVRQKIRDLLQGIQDEFKQGGEHILRFRKMQPDAFIRSLGLDLSPAQRRRLRQGLAGIGPGGTVGAQSSAFALAGGVTFNGPVTFNGVHDVKTMEHELGKRSKARSHQRRGAR